MAPLPSTLRSTCKLLCRGISTAVRRDLSALLPDRVSCAEAILEQHGKDESYHKLRRPDVVVFPENTEEVVNILKLCHASRTPVVPFGAGTSLEGHVGAVEGGVCLDMSRLNRILTVNQPDMDCRVQAGVTRVQLNEYLHDTGLFFPVDPGANATLGGMAATRASGTNAVRYGTMKDVVMGMTVVLAHGEVLRLGTRARKSSAGYDLVRLMVGSEGTLGVITELVLRLSPQPEHVASAVCTFPSMTAATQAVTNVMQSAIPVARIEVLDEVALDAVNRYSKTSLAVTPTLFFEFHGSPAAVKDQVSAVELVCGEFQGAFSWATAPEDRNRLWAARHTAYWAAVALRPGGKGLVTDVCVPISRLAECVEQAQVAAKQVGLLAPMVGHAGDGNFHMMIIIDPNDPEEVSRAASYSAQLVEMSLACGGTCTGEHGIGLGKLPYLLREAGPGPVGAMHMIKRALDPLNILNPGKLGINPGLIRPDHACYE